MRSSLTDWSPLGLDDDPTPGDVDAVVWRSKDFGSTAEWLWYRADRLDEVLELVGEPHWSGEAAVVFAERLDTVSRACRSASTRFSAARDVSHRWASAMWSQQGAADAALLEAVEALEEIAVAEASIGLLTTEHASLLAALTRLESAQRQYATTIPPAGTHVPTGSEVAAARRHAETANLELRNAHTQLEDAYARLRQAKFTAEAAEEEYSAEEGVFVQSLEATLDGAMSPIAPGQLDDFVTTIDAYAKLIPLVDPADELMEMLTELSPRELALLFGRDPALAQKFWDNPPPPGAVAGWWKNLSPEVREQWCQAAPDIIGNLPGLDADSRIHANAIQLQRDLNDPTINPDSARGKTLKDILAALGLKKIPGGSAADYERLAKAQKPARGLLSYNLRHDPPLAAVAIGDTRAEACGKVTWMVPGMDSGLGEPGRMKGWTEAGVNLYNKQMYMDGLPHMVVAWIGYAPPVSGNTDVLHGDNAKAAARRLRAELEGQWAADTVLGGNPHPYTGVVGHSYGTTVVSNAVGDLIHNVQSVVFVASAGVEGGFQSVKNLHVDGGTQHVYATQSSRDGVADLGRFGSGRVDPRDGQYGSGVYSSEGDPAQHLQPTDGHDTLGHGPDRGSLLEPHATSGHGYFDNDTEALHNTAAATLGLDGNINGGVAFNPMHPFEHLPVAP
ncbi:Alpha/beta hydrolase [Leifsonia sp. CL147]|nr:Alpha/beta hydrolase [Leifsonia sp. CL154]SFL33493.1 Alpha/beta hydrolase [Leifsonia sp. CL147]